MIYRLTARHLKIYRNAVERYMKLYRLSGWHCEFHLEVGSKEGMASVGITDESPRADFYLNPAWSEEPTRQRIFDKARHEVFHVFVSPLARLAAARYVTEAQLYRTEEDLVVLLTEITENLKQPPPRKKAVKAAIVEPAVSPGVTGAD